MSTEHPPILLIVDDKPANLKLLFEFLKQTGYRTLAAQSGRDALMLADKSQPDLILLDVMMPGLDGYETCRRLKANPRTKAIPVIFMTALADTEHKLKAFESGAIDFITKPLQHEEVLARVNAHLQVAALRKETDDFLQLLLQMALQKSWKDVLTACANYVRLRPDIQAAAFWQKDPITSTYQLKQLLSGSNTLYGTPPLQVLPVDTTTLTHATDPSCWERPDGPLKTTSLPMSPPRLITRMNPSVF